MFGVNFQLKDLNIFCTLLHRKLIKLNRLQLMRMGQLSDPGQPGSAQGFFFAGRILVSLGMKV